MSTNISAAPLNGDPFNVALPRGWQAIGMHFAALLIFGVFRLLCNASRFLKTQPWGSRSSENKEFSEQSRRLIL